MGILGVLVNIGSHPLSQSQSLSRSNIVEVLEDLVDDGEGLGRGHFLTSVDAEQSLSDVSSDSLGAALAEEYLVESQLLDLGLACVQYVRPEVELLFAGCVDFVSSLEVLPNQAHGNVQVDLLVLVQNPIDEVNEQDERSVCFRRRLHFHGPELNQRAILPVRGEFEPDRTPVGDVEEVKQVVRLLAHGLVLLVCVEQVPSENACQVTH